MLEEEITKVLRELLEDDEPDEKSDAAKEAEKLGLDYLHFGRWGKGGEVTHMTGDDGKLVPVSEPPREPKGATKKKTDPEPKKRPTKLSKAVDKAKDPQFRRRIKIGPGMTVNVRRDGVGGSIGVPGFQLTKGRKGTHLHLGIPGSGLYRRLNMDKFSFEDTGHPKQKVQFRRRIPIGQGMFVNLTRSGIGFKIGVPGFQVTRGPAGTMVHLGVPGTGVFKKFQI